MISMTTQQPCFLAMFATLLFLGTSTTAFVVKTTLTPTITTTTTPFSSTALHMSKATLTEETDWNLRLVLKSVVTENDKKVDEIFVVQGKFIEEEGYEPPQGTFLQSSDESSVKIANSRWQLSEDPNDRKDGLWVWGLFKEPLYPFMLLKLETEAIPIAGGDSIQPLSLYAQINHKRDNELGVVLDGSTLNIRQVETIKADPFGAATAEYYEEVAVGNISIQKAVPGKVKVVEGEETKTE